MSMKYTLRLAKPEDAEKLLEIYAPFVISSDRTLSDVSFEYEVPSVEEFTERIKNISADYPYIVCEHEGRLHFDAVLIAGSNAGVGNNYPLQAQ